MISRFNKFYKSIIKQDSDIDTETKKKTSSTTKKEETAKPVEEKTSEEDSGVKTLEKNFLDKFIRYNELQLLMKDLPDIANSFKSVQGFDEQLIRDTVEKLLADRQKEIDSLTKELTDLREKITKEAEVANYKKSVIDIFNGQAVKLNENDSPYGYIAKSADDNGFNKGETIAGPDGVPTVSVGMPEVTDDGDPNKLMTPEELPADEKEPSNIEDLNQAIEKDADTIEIPMIPKQAGKLTPKRLKSLKRTNLDKTPLLIDSKKKKKSKK